MNSSATDFLLSIRSSYKAARLFLPEYLTFFVSPEIFQQYCEEIKSTARLLSDNSPVQKFMLKQIRVREDPALSDMRIRISERKIDWETL